MFRLRERASSWSLSSNNTSSTTQKSIVYSGYLWKKLNWRKNIWHRYWVVLDAKGTLQFYHKESSIWLRAKYLLSDEHERVKIVPVVRQVDVPNIMSRVRSRSRSYSGDALDLEFRLEFASQTISLAAESEDEYKNWLNSLKRDMIHDFHIIKELGKGSTATVLLGQNDDLALFALKICNQHLLRKVRDIKRVGRKMVVKTGLDKIHEEIAIMKKLAHPNIVGLHQVLLDQVDEKIILVLDFAEHGQLMTWDSNMKKYTNFMPEPTARRYFQQMVQGLNYLHQNRICHRDLKPENILIHSDHTIMISDFGVAHMFDPDDSNQLSTSAGTYAFMPPESMLGEQYCAFRADIWALGITLYAMIYGHLPFLSSNVDELFDQIETIEPEIPPHTDPALAHLLKGMLMKNPNDRLTLDEIGQHEWLYDGDWTFHPKHARIEVSNEEMGKAFTPLLSFEAITRMKMMANKWRGRSRLGSAPHVA